MKPRLDDFCKTCFAHHNLRHATPKTCNTLSVLIYHQAPPYSPSPLPHIHLFNESLLLFSDTQSLLKCFAVYLNCKIVYACEAPCKLWFHKHQCVLTIIVKNISVRNTTWVTKQVKLALVLAVFADQQSENTTGWLQNSGQYFGKKQGINIL